MAFDCGFEIGKQATEQMVASLREHNPALLRASKEELTRQASKEDFLGALAEIRGLTPIERISNLVDRDMVMEFDRSIMRNGLMVPVCKTDDRLTVAIADPYNSIGLDYCRRQAPSAELVVLLTHTSEINLVLEQRTDIEGITSEEVRQIEVSEHRQAVKDFDLSVRSEDGVVRELQSIINKALQYHASDIHFNTEKDWFYYTYRIDGDLTERVELDSKLIPRIDNILVTTANHPSEARNTGKPLSGRFTLGTGTRRVAVRYERVPTYRGFHVTLRLLDKSHINVKLGEGALDIDPISMSFLRQIMDLPHGIVVISGATGSGKSTTLTAILKELNLTKYNIMTLENPVEEEIKGITHVNLEEMSECPMFIGSFMRSDPDIILIGEVRDRASAEVAIEAAVTGHQVFTSIHTSSASMIITRFMQLGIERFKVAETLRGACAQRLVRTLCENCKQPHNVEEFDVKRYQLPEEMNGAEVFRANPGGCANCFKTGYRGRRAIIEVLPITEDVSELIMADTATSHKIGKYIRETKGIPSLKDSAIKLFRNGYTDLSALKDVVALGLE